MLRPEYFRLNKFIYLMLLFFIFKNFIDNLWYIYYIIIL
jgi:hypothetical protein